MGNSTSSGPLEIENDPLYKTSNSAGQFSMEKSIRYRVGSRTCTIRLSANNNNNHFDKVSVALFDFCDGDEAGVNVCVGIERDSNGSRIGSQKVKYHGDVAADSPGENKVSLSYGCPLREGLMIIENREEALLIAHNYCCIERAQCLTVFVDIQCDRRTGLSVTVRGPFEDAINLRTMQDLHLRRLRSLKEGSQFPNNALQLQSALKVLLGDSSTRGLINNVGGSTNGNYNGSVITQIFNNCKGHNPSA